MIRLVLSFSSLKGIRWSMWNCGLIGVLTGWKIPVSSIISNFSISVVWSSSTSCGIFLLSSSPKCWDVFPSSFVTKCSSNVDLNLAMYVLFFDNNQLIVIKACIYRASVVEYAWCSSHFIQNEEFERARHYFELSISCIFQAKGPSTYFQRLVLRLLWAWEIFRWFHEHRVFKNSILKEGLKNVCVAFAHCSAGSELRRSHLLWNLSRMRSILL